MRSFNVPICFNSKLVRLKVLGENFSQLGAKMFQFQTGAIKSPPSKACVGYVAEFQFQTGAIKSALGKSGDDAGKKVFQFQTGAIKRSCRLATLSSTHFQFQFQTGAIKR